ncbi:MAG: hypothetical protein LBQ29_08505 [Acinetobacter sp.]|jgi:hypothetical protein|uniref:hypothetical protein n=1 Tax=Acinetobacter sp. TaxID=472 RepID=UPI002825E614|nr:hypothetical protein [Acinetobacter sp.]MDR2061419.1 hypothetical protein [Acinetobacter sp.]
MNAIQFIKDHGVEKAREVVEGAPKNAQRYLDGMYFKQGEWTWFWSLTVSKWLQYEKHIYSTSRFDFAVDLSDLKRLVESLDLVELLGGIELLKRKIDGKHIGYTHFSINGNGRWSFLDHYIDFIPDSAYHIGMVNKAIADYESIGGEHV